MSLVDIFSTESDLYPSRTGDPGRFLDRKDPVIHSKLCDDSQIAEVIPLTKEQITQYEECGFLVIEDLFSENEIELLTQELERLRHSADNQTHPEELITEPHSGDMRSVFKIHERNKLFERISKDERLVQIARFILGDDVYIHQSRLNYKPGFKGEPFYWHSDFETWHVEDGMPRMQALSMSIALTNNYQFNGPLMLIPGSHKTYISCEGTTPKDNFKTSLKNQTVGVPSEDCLRNLAEQSGIVSVTTKPGSVIIFDCNTMHGSNGNITPYPRSNLFFVYNAISNRVTAPYSDLPARPDYLCTRSNIRPIRLSQRLTEHE